jgi:hypothetical protein
MEKNVTDDTKTSHRISEADFSEPRHTSLGVSSKKLLVLPNCNILDKTRGWMGPLLPQSGTLNRGCSVNVLRFLGEIGLQNANHLLEEIDVGKYSDVIPFSYIVDIFNSKIVNTEDFLPGKGSEFSVQEARLPIDNTENIADFFTTLEQNMPDNSCILVRLNRSEAARGLATSGHDIVITKDNGIIKTIEPYKSPAGVLDIRNYTSPPSVNFVRAWNQQMYVTASLLVLTIITKRDKKGGGNGDINGSVMIPEKMVQQIEEAFKMSIECKNEPRVGGGRKTRRNKRRKTRRNKTNKKRNKKTNKTNKKTNKTNKKQI